MILHLFFGFLTSAIAATQSPSPSLSPSPSFSPITCTQEHTSEIVLGALLGASLTGIVGTCLFRRYCVLAHNGDPDRVYDTPCPYCGKKQPADCMREHISECMEHLKHWAPKRASQREIDFIHVRKGDDSKTDRALAIDLRP
jgi:hypothetical protein